MYVLFFFTDRHILCDPYKRRIFCSGSKRINMISGKWGRDISSNVCWSPSITLSGCRKDVTYKLKTLCDGLLFCDIYANKTFFDNHDPCEGSPGYAEFIFECINGESYYIFVIRLCCLFTCLCCLVNWLLLLITSSTGETVETPAWFPGKKTQIGMFYYVVNVAVSQYMLIVEKYV